MSDDTKKNASKVEKGGSKGVTIALKLPHGLRLKLYKMIPFTEPVIGGGTRESKRAEQVGEEVVLNGYAKPFGAEPKCIVAGGYALTSNVNREFIAEWLKQNSDHPVVKNNLLLVQDDDHGAQDEAKEKKAITNGLEPLNPDKLPNVGKGSGLKVETFKQEAA